MKKRVSLLALPLLAASALAQDTLDGDEQPEVRRYTVEMIIFAYAQNVSVGSEIFVPDLPPVEELLEGEDQQDEIPVELPEPLPEAEATVEVDAEEDSQYELVMLAEEDFELVAAYEHLQRLDAYEPLMHFGWTQPTYPDEEVPARPLSSFMTPPDGLEGELTLYLSRYLHLAVKLQLDAPAEDESVDDEFEETIVRSSFDDGYFGFGGDAPVNFPVRYRIDEDRIFRNGELRYFDHPKFGVLARITRVEEEEPEDAEFPVAIEMLGDQDLIGGDVE